MEKVLVLGLGNNGGGRSAALYFAGRPGCQVRVSDAAPRESFSSVPSELEALGVECHFGADPRDDIRWADVVIKNPAVPSSMPQLSLAKRLANDFSYLFTHPAARDIKLIVVTGTKGKSTTVAAIQHGLMAMGHEALMCGNIGISGFTILDELEKRTQAGVKLPEYIVIELSSWQIHDTYVALNGMLPHFDLAILTSKYADHQNRYGSMREYFDDKLRLFGPHCRLILVGEKEKDFFLSHTYGLKKRVHVFPGHNNPFKDKKKELQCAYSALKLIGFHKKDVVKALSSYKGIPHRLEQVALYKDLMFVNDSAATIAEAVAFSMNSIAPLSTHLICGGTDKNLKAQGMAKALSNAASITLLDGSFTQSVLIPLLEKKGLAYHGPFKTMKEAFNSAVKEAEAKRDEFKQVQCVLLSPGAASFELFKNESDRGNQFKALVRIYMAKDSGLKSFPLS